MTGGTKTVKVRTPIKVEEIGQGSKITSPVFGGSSKMQIKDEDDQNFTVSGITVNESSQSLSYYLVKDNVVVAGDDGTARVGSDDVFTTDANGQFSDNIGMPLSDLTALANFYNAQNTFRLVVTIIGHEYEAKIGTTVFGLTNKYNRSVSIQVKKTTSGWGSDTQNHTYVSIKQ